MSTEVVRTITTQSQRNLNIGEKGTLLERRMQIPSEQRDNDTDDDGKGKGISSKSNINQQLNKVNDSVADEAAKLNNVVNDSYDLSISVAGMAALLAESKAKSSEDKLRSVVEESNDNESMTEFGTKIAIRAFEKSMDDNKVISLERAN